MPDARTIVIPYIDSEGLSAEMISAVLNESGVKWNKIDCVDWPEDYPYAPLAQFRIAYTETALIIEYRVTESGTKAVATQDNGRVWEDSCVEMFLSPYPHSDIYYNLEANCIGTVLLANRGGGRETEHAPKEVLRSIERYSSLRNTQSAVAVGSSARRPLSEIKDENTWTLALKVPYGAFWKDAGRFPPADTMRLNFYKCGDKMPSPHFLSWSPITAPKPNFHLPQFFGTASWAHKG